MRRGRGKEEGEKEDLNKEGNEFQGMGKGKER